jgi:hypothetical protein
MTRSAEHDVEAYHCCYRKLRSNDSNSPQEHKTAGKRTQGAHQDITDVSSHDFTERVLVRIRPQLKEAVQLVDTEVGA